MTKLTAHSIFAPDTRTTSAHLGISAAMKAAKSAGVPIFGSA